MGAKPRDEGGTNPLTAIPPSVKRPQSLAQDLLEIAGPAGCFAPFRQQHLARLREQEAVDALKELADNCTRDAEDNNSARHAAISARIG